MSRTFTVFTTALFITTFIPHSQTSAQGTTYSPWPMFGGNPQHTHRGTSAVSVEPEVLWQYTPSIFEHITTSPVITQDGSICFVVGGHDKLISLKQQGDTFKVNWSFQTGDDIFPATPTVGPNGTIHIVVEDGLVAVNPDGSLMWHIEVDILRSTCVTVDPIGHIYAVGFTESDDKSHLFSISPDGIINWSIQMGGSSCTPAIDSNGRIYVGSDHLYAIDPDGEVPWQYIDNPTYGGKFIGSSPSIGADGTIYIGSASSNLYAINQDGTLKWKTLLSGTIKESPSIGPDGTIYTIGGSILYAINPNGDILWQMENIRSVPVIDGKGTLYAGARIPGLILPTYYLYAINPDGTIKWEYQFEKEPKLTPALGADGTLYVTTSYGSIYAFAHETPTAITEEPASFHVNAPYPNPFNASVTIEYVMLHGGHVRCAVYDMLGRKVATPQEGTLSAGTHRAVWDGRDKTGRNSASGTYFYRIEAAGMAESGKVMLLR